MPLPFPSKAPAQYTTSKQLIAGSDFNNVVAQLNSAEDAITATPAGTQATSYQLKSAVNTIATVATAADGVKLPKGFVGLEVWIRNDDADAIQVFGYNPDTINGVATATGVVQNGSTTTIYRCNSVSAAGVANWITK